MDLPLDEIKHINFSRKKIPISPELRPMFKISQIVLILYISSTKQTASLLKLQLFNWALKKTARYERLLKLKETKHFPIIRFDPFLNRALNYGIAMDLFSFNENTGKFTLSAKGEGFALAIINQEDLLEEEKVFLHSIKKSLSDSFLLSIFKEEYQS
ncbi:MULTISPECIES: hypothetical protein [Bacillus cereus group]|uniref:hypothetical protein n=1 Tax=Bacillus cereus group TaxID=86661 RepID=UPI000BF950CE|nr:hypothetical protein [Bacillus cereus]PFN68720.1 hypothetical protein COJ59_14360 [Bacillus cereus]